MKNYIKNIESGKESSTEQKFFFSNEFDEFMAYKQIVKPLPHSIALNTSLWNNSRVSHLTGYTMEMLREPLHQLA